MPGIKLLMTKNVDVSTPDEDSGVTVLEGDVRDVPSLLSLGYEVVGLSDGW